MTVIQDPASPIVPKLEGVHLFHFDGAPCAQRVRFALHEKGLLRGREVPFDADDPDSLRGEEGAWVSRHVSLVKRDHMTEAYAQIQPNLVVPALVHDGVLHVESMDIVEYLDGAFGGTPLIPRHDKEQLAAAEALTQRGKDLHRSIRFVTYRWGLGGLARLNAREEEQLRELLKGRDDGEQLVSFYEGYDTRSIPESVYEDHLHALNNAFADLENQLRDGRHFLTGDSLTMADVIWVMKTQRLVECAYPFERFFPRYWAWFRGVAERPAFRDGVMGKNRLMSGAFRAKATVEHLLGMGLRRKVISTLG